MVTATAPGDPEAASYSSCDDQHLRAGHAQHRGRPPALFAINIVTANGEVFNAGDVCVEFAIESISKVFTMAVAMEQIGARTFREKVGTRPHRAALQLRHGLGAPRRQTHVCPRQRGRDLLYEPSSPPRILRIAGARSLTASARSLVVPSRSAKQ